MRDTYLLPDEITEEMVDEAIALTMHEPLSEADTDEGTDVLFALWGTRWLHGKVFQKEGRGAWVQYTETPLHGEAPNYGDEEEFVDWPDLKRLPA